MGVFVNIPENDTLKRRKLCFKREGYWGFPHVKEVLMLDLVSDNSNTVVANGFS